MKLGNDFKTIFLCKVNFPIVNTYYTIQVTKMTLTYSRNKLKVRIVQLLKSILNLENISIDLIYFSTQKIPNFKVLKKFVYCFHFYDVERHAFSCVCVNLGDSTTTDGVNALQPNSPYFACQRVVCIVYG